MGLEYGKVNVVALAAYLGSLSIEMRMTLTLSCIVTCDELQITLDSPFAIASFASSFVLHCPSWSEHTF